MRAVRARPYPGKRIEREQGTAAIVFCMARTARRWQDNSLAIAALGLAAIIALLNSWFEMPWRWFLLALQIGLLVAGIYYLGRYVLRQRDDYWRERGKDPKHPES
jgi:hypothetical protein